jgi:hypothetical protein
MNTGSTISGAYMNSGITISGDDMNSGLTISGGDMNSGLTMTYDDTLGRVRKIWAVVNPVITDPCMQRYGRLGKPSNNEEA